MRRHRGFTLLEAMVAISILAAMGGLIWGSFGPSFELKAAVEQQAEQQQEIRGAMNRMAREISMAFLSNDFDKVRYREQLTLFKGEHNGGDRDHLIFTSLAHQRLFDNALESDQSVIEYKVEDSRDHPGRTDLMRREKTVLDDQPERDGTPFEVLCEDIQGLRLAYWDDTKKEWADEWNSHDVTRTNTLPFRVRIVLLVGPSGKTPEKYTTEAQVFLLASMDRNQ
jgi:general secretion pathway protein J